MPNYRAGENFSFSKETREIGVIFFTHRTSAPMTNVANFFNSFRPVLSFT